MEILGYFVKINKNYKAGFLWKNGYRGFFGLIMQVISMCCNFVWDEYKQYGLGQGKIKIYEIPNMNILQLLY